MKKTLLTAALCLVAASLVWCAKDKDTQKPIKSGIAIKGDNGYTSTLSVEKMHFSWKISGDALAIRLKAPTAGWVGIGFNPTDGMKDAHFIIGYVKDGAVTVSDQHGISKTAHRSNIDLGGVASVMNAAGEEKNNETEIRFTVPLQSKDRIDKSISVNEDITIMLAYGQSDIMAQQHSFRARLTVNLSTGRYAVFSTAEKK